MQAAVAFPHVKRRHGNIKVMRCELKNTAAQRLQGLMAHRLFRQLPLAGAQPRQLRQQLGIVGLQLHRLGIGV